MTRHEKKAHWQSHVEGFKASTLSLRAYARRAGVTVSGLQYWRKRLARDERGCAPRSPQAAPERFLPVTWVGGAGRGTEPALLEIVLRSGHIVRLSGPIETTWLAAVVQTLETPCS